MGITMCCITDDNDPVTVNTEKKVEDEPSKSTDLNLVLYADGLYESTKKPNTTYTKGIIESYFNTIVLWTLHVRENGDLVYNDSLIASNGKLQPSFNTSGTNITANIKELRTSGNVKRVLFSIGSGSWYDKETKKYKINPDWFNLHKILFNGTKKEKDNLFNNFGVLISLGIDGFDSDCEEWGWPKLHPLTDKEYIATHVQLFSELYKSNTNLIFTFVPYDKMNNWTNIGKQLYTVCNVQIIKFWSLQMYDGGNGNNIKKWIDNIRTNMKELGLTPQEVNDYIIPGYSNINDETGAGDMPSAIKDIFSKLKGYNINGGMIWNLSQSYDKTGKPKSGQTLQEYSQAIIDGL